MRAAIDELGYIPNQIARSLRSNRTNTLALVLTDITNPFWTTVARSVEDTASAQGFNVILCNTDEREDKQDEYLSVLLRKRVDGFLFVPARSEPDAVESIQRQKVPVVVMDRRVPGAEVDVVRLDIPNLGRWRPLRPWYFPWLVQAWLRKYPQPFVFSLERQWRQDLLRAGDGIHAEWLQRRRPLRNGLLNTLTSVSPYHRLTMMGERRAYHHTAPISMIYALHEALALVLEEGMEARWARHERNGRALQAGLEAMGLTLHAQEGYRLPVLTTVRIPDGVNDAEVRGALLRRNGIEIGGGLGELKGRIWRVGLMGESSTAGNVLLFLSALGRILREQGFRADVRGAVSAAESRLAGD